MPTLEPDPTLAMLRRLENAVNAHDLDAVVDCFASDYLNETPAHPARGFTGREQVRRNWTEIFGGVPDLRARVLRWAVDGDTIWGEWEMAGTRRDGRPHLMRGVIVFGVRDGRAKWSRFYLEPVDDSPDGVEPTVHTQVGAR
ncbi:nuclear transport factor 2 family protein (plasmid) [Rhodococcus sp. USK10]|uniref:nuclear transport factor 2 family protein n=1 Tax=Rhodococcus sp. USK10 TaxID=2789739 RepID=UPI001C5CDF11|nr:nuclear transport factor 2 family protein [Rhodococcus sp. USK10]QYB00618.1 nuclear transport factor 2 family protein [Rhodococcus sp. USK10]